MNDMIQIDFQAVGYYNGQTTNKNGDIIFKLKFSYDERGSMAKFMALVGQIIKLGAQVSGNEIKNIGEFSYEKMLIDRDGQIVLQLATEYDCINHGVVEDLLPERGSKTGIIVKFYFGSSVEMEETVGNAEDEWETIEKEETGEEDWS